MLEKTVHVPTPDGRMETFVVAPGASACPCVVIATDAPGVRDEVRGIARDFASRGFCALLPDLYHRQGCLRFRPPLTGADRRRIEPARRELTVDRCAADGVSVLEFLVGEPWADERRVAFMGLCIGSGWVMAALAAAGERIGAAALIDGCELGDRLGAEPRFAGPISTRVFLAFASEMSQGFSDALTRLVESGRVAPRTEIVPGVRHGFCFRDWPGGVYDEGARESVFERASRFFVETFEAGA